MNVSKIFNSDSYCSDILRYCSELSNNYRKIAPYIARPIHYIPLMY